MERLLYEAKWLRLRSEVTFGRGEMIMGRSDCNSNHELKKEKELFPRDARVYRFIHRLKPKAKLHSQHKSHSQWTSPQSGSFWKKCFWQKRRRHDSIISLKLQKNNREKIWALRKVWSLVSSFNVWDFQDLITSLHSRTFLVWELWTFGEENR